MKNLYSKLKFRESIKFSLLKNKKAFTLVEMMVVVVIISILATIWFLRLGNYSSEANVAKRASDKKNIEQVLEMYKSKEWNYPEFEEENGEKIFWTWTWEKVKNRLPVMPVDPITKKPYKIAFLPSWKYGKIAMVDLDGEIAKANPENTKNILPETEAKNQDLNTQRQQALENAKTAAREEIERIAREEIGKVNTSGWSQSEKTNLIDRINTAKATAIWNINRANSESSVTQAKNTWAEEIRKIYRDHNAAKERERQQVSTVLKYQPKVGKTLLGEAIVIPVYGDNHHQGEIISYTPQSEITGNDGKVYVPKVKDNQTVTLKDIPQTVDVEYVEKQASTVVKYQPKVGESALGEAYDTKERERQQALTNAKSAAIQEIEGIAREEIGKVNTSWLTQSEKTDLINSINTAKATTEWNINRANSESSVTQAKNTWVEEIRKIYRDFNTDSRYRFLDWTKKWDNWIVLDKNTNLIWESKNDQLLTYDDAINYCTNLKKWNKKWRLPNFKEIESLNDIDGNFFVLTDWSYWSSTRKWRWGFKRYYQYLIKRKLSAPSIYEYRAISNTKFYLICVTN